SWVLLFGDLASTDLSYCFEQSSSSVERCAGVGKRRARSAGTRRSGTGGSAPSHMRRAEFDALVHEIGELRELLLDVAFGAAAIDHEHLPRLLHFGDGDGWRGVAEALSPGDNEERPEAGNRPRAVGEGLFDAERVEDVGGVGVREGEFPVVVAGQEVETLAIGFVEDEADGH